MFLVTFLMYYTKLYCRYFRLFLNVINKCLLMYFRAFYQNSQFFVLFCFLYFDVLSVLFYILLKPPKAYFDFYYETFLSLLRLFPPFRSLSRSSKDSLLFVFIILFFFFLPTPSHWSETFSCLVLNLFLACSICFLMSFEGI